MKKLLTLLVLLCLEKSLHAQYIYTIKADSVKITNTCDTAELIIENHTQNVPGFLFNKGTGRTEFRRGLLTLNDSVFLIGADTLDFSKALGNKFYKKGGNSFGTTALLGTKDNYPLTFIQNGIEKGRIDTGGNWLFNTTTNNGYPFQFKGNIWHSGTLYQDKNVNIVPVGGVPGDARINIGSANSVIGHGATAIGSFIRVDATGSAAFGIGFNISVMPGGIGLLGSAGKAGVAIGASSYAQTGVALGTQSRTTGPYQFVCGGPNYVGQYPYSTQISDIYFGSGVQRDSIEGAGISYAINGAGGYGTDYAGGNITIAGGKGTGAGTPGSIIFSSAAITNSGSTLQSLSEKARIAGSSGNFLINTTIDNGHRLNVNGTVYIADTLKMPNIISKSDTASYDPVVIDAYGNVFKMAAWNVPQIVRTAVADAGYSALTSDYIIAYTSLSAPRTVTLPAATNMNNHILIIKDESGAAGTYNITVNVTAGGTIDGVTSKTVNTNYGLLEVYSNGSQWFTK